MNSPRAASETKINPNDSQWNAVLMRDATADGQFVYSVKSTGVYCRPSCPARRALRQNVSFFATCADAESAGFRPCLRCKPNSVSPQKQIAAKIASACRFIENADEAPTLGKLAEYTGWSPYHLQRIFKAATGVSPAAYAAAQRGKRVRHNLREQSSVTDAIYAAGYSSSSRFYEKSNGLLGMTPTTYRKGGDGMSIDFTTGESSLGSILVAKSERGICAILLGDNARSLIHDLSARFPLAKITRGDTGFDHVIREVIRVVELPKRPLDLPFDIRGTAFQRRVWQALREIPPGATATYGDIAKRIGAPKSVRAVAQACAANALAVAIPCHRAVAKDGSLAGYRWGLKRKRILLDREAEK